MRLLLAAVAALALAGCTDPAPPGGAGPAGDRALRFDHVDGCEAHEPTELYQVVQDEDAWRALWAERCVSPDIIPMDREDAPQVDFTLASAVAAFWGEKERGGYAIEVANLTERTDHTAIRVLRGSPGPGCATIEVLTYPADVVVAERITKAARFTFEDVTVDC